jgi:hypothetical protein
MALILFLSFFFSKSQFRIVLRDAGIVPNSAKDTFAPLKLHTTDLVFAQASRTESTGDPPHRLTGNLFFFYSSKRSHSFTVTYFPI